MASLHLGVRLLFLLVLLMLVGAALAQPAPSPATAPFPATDPAPAPASAQSTRSAKQPYPPALSQILTDLEKAATIAGIFAAGVWAYFNFFRGRTYRPRLEPQVSGTLISTHNGIFLVAAYQVKNVGLSKVDIQQDGSGLTVLVPEMPDTLEFVREIRWKTVTAFDILTSHEWVEPGELIREERLIALPDDTYVAVRVEIRLCSRQKTEWRAMTVVSPPRAEATPVANVELMKRS